MRPRVEEQKEAAPSWLISFIPAFQYPLVCNTYRMDSLNTYVGLKQIHLVWKILCVAPWTKYNRYYYAWMSFFFGINIFFISMIFFDFVFCKDSKCVLNNMTIYLASLCKVGQCVIMVFVCKKLLQLEKLFHILDESVT